MDKKLSTTEDWDRTDVFLVPIREIRCSTIRTYPHLSGPIKGEKSLFRDSSFENERMGRQKSGNVALLCTTLHHFAPVCTIL